MEHLSKMYVFSKKLLAQSKYMNFIFNFFLFVYYIKMDNILYLSAEPEARQSSYTENNNVDFILAVGD